MTSSECEILIRNKRKENYEVMQDMVANYCAGWDSLDQGPGLPKFDSEDGIKELQDPEFDPGQDIQILKYKTYILD